MNGFRAAACLVLAAIIGAMVAMPQGAAARGGPPPAPEGFDAKACGERHQRLFAGDFDQFWTYAERHGWNGVGEFAWSVPQGAAETDADWRARAMECFLEVERRNAHRKEPVYLYALGYFLWYGGAVFGFERDPSKQPGVRERGYRKLLTARKEGYRKAAEALVGVHYNMVRAIDTAALRAGRSSIANGKGDAAAPIPNWWPSNKRLLEDLATMGAQGRASAYLSLSTIYRERWLMSQYFGIDHTGRRVDAPDPELRRAFETYDYWYQILVSRQGKTLGLSSPRPPADDGATN